VVVASVIPGPPQAKPGIHLDRIMRCSGESKIAMTTLFIFDSTAMEIMDVNANTVTDAMRSAGVHRLIHRHTPVPQRIDSSWKISPPRASS
jgi:hypothetical protein